MSAFVQGRLSEHDPGAIEWVELIRYAIYVPELHMTCVVKLQNRPNEGHSTLGVWVWDDTATLPQRFPYAYQSEREPPLPSNLSMVEIGPLSMTHTPDGTTRLHYVDEGRLSFDILCQQIMPHYEDQPNEKYAMSVRPLRSTGTIRLPDWSARLDGPAMSRHAWGVPPPTGHTGFGCSGVGADNYFKVRRTLNEASETESIEGCVYRDGELAKVRSASRRVSQYFDGYPFDVELTIVDELERETVLHGDAANAAELDSYPRAAAISSLMSWTSPDDAANHSSWGNDWQTTSFAGAAIPLDFPRGLSRSANSDRTRIGQPADPSAAEVLSATTKFCLAIEEADFAGMCRRWEQTSRATCVHPGSGSIRGWQQVAASWSDLLRAPLELILSNVSITVDGDQAVAVYDYDLVRNTHPPPPVVLLTASTTFSYHRGSWLVLFHHASYVDASTRLSED